MIYLIVEHLNKKILIEINENRVYYSSTKPCSIKTLFNLIKIDFSTLKNEDEIKDYIIEELRKRGYIPLFMQRRGFKVEIIE